MKRSAAAAAALLVIVLAHVTDARDMSRFPRAANGTLYLPHFAEGDCLAPPDGGYLSHELFASECGDIGANDSPYVVVANCSCFFCADKADPVDTPFVDVAGSSEFEKCGEGDIYVAVKDRELNDEAVY